LSETLVLSDFEVSEASVSSSFEVLDIVADFSLSVQPENNVIVKSRMIQMDFLKIAITPFISLIIFWKLIKAFPIIYRQQEA